MSVFNCAKIVETIASWRAIVSHLIFYLRVMYQIDGLKLSPSPCVYKARMTVTFNRVVSGNQARVATLADITVIEGVIDKLNGYVNEQADDEATKNSLALAELEQVNRLEQLKVLCADIEKMYDWRIRKLERLNSGVRIADIHRILRLDRAVAAQIQSR